MSSGDEYRSKAAELNARTHREMNARIRIELENLALSYLRLAEQADRNARTDMVVEADSHRVVVQQQQQLQPKPEPEK